MPPYTKVVHIIPSFDKDVIFPSYIISFQLNVWYVLFSIPVQSKHTLVPSTVLFYYKTILKICWKHVFWTTMFFS